MAGIYTSVAIKNLVSHPAAGRILTRALASYEPENYSHFSDEILLIMQKSVPVHVIKTSSDQLLFFAGWELLSEFRRRNIETVWAVNAHCKGTHHVHAKVTHLWGLCARTQSGVLTRGGREA